MQYPALEAVEPLKKAFFRAGTAVLSAPPGTGKTTLLPLELLKYPPFNTGKIIMLEPRRAAARAAARRMAALLNEPPGQTIGWQVRHERQISDKTRLEIVTEGILVRRLQQDPELDGVSMVIFDEFHERSLNCDLSLALTLDVQENLRPDLKILLMSATLDTGYIAKSLPDAPQIAVAGTMFPVQTYYAGRSAERRLLPEFAAKTAIEWLKKESGSMLVFLPGAAEINRMCEICAAALPADIKIYPLYGMLDKAQQDAAILPCRPGERKLVAATNIAETSLTIDGVRMVIDSGVAKVAKFNPVNNLTKLETMHISQASAEQRRGRAGRTEPGICIRLYSEAEEKQFPPYNVPEIMDADLSGLALELANWGTAATKLNWLTPPPEAALQAAQNLLQMLNLLDKHGRLTALGRQAAAFPVHPRLAAMLLTAQAENLAGLAAEIAAVVEERAVLDECDLSEHLRYIRQNSNRCHAVCSVRDQLLKLLHTKYQECSIDHAGRLLAAAYPDRVAKSREPHSENYLTTDGRGLRLPVNHYLKRSEFLAVATVNDSGANAVIQLAAEVTLAELQNALPHLFTTQTQIDFSADRHAVLAVKQEKFGAIVLKESPLANPPAEAVAEALITAVQRKGLTALPWTPTAESLRARVNYARCHAAEFADLPDWSDEKLLATLADWLGPYLNGIKSFAQLQKIILADILRNSLDYQQLNSLNRAFPERYSTPADSDIRIDYSVYPAKLSARVQEFYGCTTHPSLNNGKMPLVLELLSPAHRPIQVTSDLLNFWQGNWELVKKEMKGRYPKHVWPDNPAEALPTKKTKNHQKATN